MKVVFWTPAADGVPCRMGRRLLFNATPPAADRLVEDVAPKGWVFANVADFADPMGQRLSSATILEAMVVLTPPQLPKDSPAPSKTVLVHGVSSFFAATYLRSARTWR